MRNFYISTKNGTTGICKYSNDFYNLILKEKNYIFLDSGIELDHIISALSVNDNIHIEIGIFQKNEIEILLVLLKSGYKNVTITLHDPPLVKFPFYEFRNPFLNKVSKFFDLHFNSGGAVKAYLKNIKVIYVLSEKGVEVVREKYRLNNVKFLPHIINTSEIEPNQNIINNFIYLGFIGKNKGLEYSLQLHQNILLTHPNIKYFVVGKALGKEVDYYNYLKNKYHKNVEYYGYLPENQLNKIFENAIFAPLFFKNYKFYYPFSGSILYALKKGKIVLTNDINTTSELIENGKNGFIFTGDLHKDTKTLLKILKDKILQKKIIDEIPHFLEKRFSAEIVNQYFNAN